MLQCIYMTGEIHEKCAVVGVSLEEGERNAPQLAFEGLFAMQHRGTEASGMAWKQSDGSLGERRADGMVKDVYHEEALHALGTMAVGHNRYATSGPKCAHPQPVLDEAIGLAFGHNGNLPQTDHLATFLEKHNIHTVGRTDSEMMGMAISQYVRMGQSLPDAVELAYPLFRGAATCVVMQDGVLVAFKDKRGIRPGVIGEVENGLVVASETCGLDILGADFLREINPGEMITLSGSQIETRQLANGDEKFDIFEIVYFMRPDSKVKGESVLEKRYRAGQELAVLHPPTTHNTDNVLVIPVPDTSVPAAEGYAEALGLRHRNAIVKNRYIGRTFMQPNQTARKTQLRRKHNLIPEPIQGRDLVFIDDSIVRLNTMPDLVSLAYQHGAKSVNVLLASPPIRFPDFYGIDTPSQNELAAANLTVEQMREKIGCDYLGFLSLSGLIRSTGLPAESFNLSCFTGEYPIGIGSRKQEIHAPVSMEYID